MEKLIDLLKRVEGILSSAKAPRNDIRIIQSLIRNLEELDTISLNEFYKHMQKIDKEGKKIIEQKIKLKNKKINTEVISNIYSKMINNENLSDSEKNILKDIEIKYPNIREFMLLDLEKLYEKISEIDENDLSKEEICIIMYFHFHKRPAQKMKKNEMLDQLKKNIYNIDYMGSMKRQYEGNEPKL